MCKNKYFERQQKRRKNRCSGFECNMFHAFNPQGSYTQQLHLNPGQVSMNPVQPFYFPNIFSSQISFQLPQGVPSQFQIESLVNPVFRTQEFSETLLNNVLKDLKENRNLLSDKNLSANLPRRASSKKEEQYPTTEKQEEKGWSINARVTTPQNVMMNSTTLRRFDPKQRAMVLKRYREKRQRRNFRKVRYQQRKDSAQNRPRRGGRFVKKEL